MYKIGETKGLLIESMEGSIMRMRSAADWAFSWDHQEIAEFKRALYYFQFITVYENSYLTSINGKHFTFLYLF